jgi:hypothetical protein
MGSHLIRCCVSRSKVTTVRTASIVVCTWTMDVKFIGAVLRIVTNLSFEAISGDGFIDVSVGRTDFEVEPTQAQRSQSYKSKQRGTRQTIE